MQTFGALLVSFLVASGALAAPAPSRFGQTASRASVPVLHNRGYHGSGTLARAKAYRKFGQPMPKHLKAAVSKVLSVPVAVHARDTGSVTAGSVNGDIQYLAQVQIGTPPQTIPLDFDTGSSDLWVFSSDTPSGQVNGQTIYLPGDSSTAQIIDGARWNITYGDKSSSAGDVYTDVVTVGGLTVQSQAVESAETVSSTFTADSADSGLLGLAFSTLNTVTPNQQSTFFDNAQSSLDNFLFTADLKHNANGCYNFGYIDQSGYTGDIYYTPVDNSQGFWTFTSAGYQVGSGYTTATPMTGIADTGTTLLLLDDAVVQDYYGQVSSAQYSSTDGGYVFDCSETLPDFTFMVGDGTVTVPGVYINFNSVGDGSCYGGMQSNDGIGFNIFGDVALKSAFVVFDAENMQLGWAAKDL